MDKDLHVIRKTNWFYFNWIAKQPNQMEKVHILPVKLCFKWYMTGAQPKPYWQDLWALDRSCDLQWSAAFARQDETKRANVEERVRARERAETCVKQSEWAREERGERKREFAERKHFCWMGEKQPWKLRQKKTKTRGRTKEVPISIHKEPVQFFSLLCLLGL